MHQHSKGDEYGLHPGLVELANLYNTKKNIAVLTNVGSLVTPLTQTDYLTQAKAIPLNLFSHLDQQTELQTSLAQGFATTGWGGRLADAMQGCNTTGFPTIVSVGGNALFATGTPDQPGDGHGGTGSRACRDSRAARLRRRGSTALQNLLSFDNGLTLVQASNAIGSSGINQATALNKALAGGTALTTVFPNTSLGTQMAQIAKIINVRAALGVNRQIFFAFLGGFDTHDGELNDQGTGPRASQPGAECFL